MVHHSKPNTLSGLQKLVQAINAQYWEHTEKFPEKPTLPNPPETSPNPSPMHPTQTTSPARILH